MFRKIATILLLTLSFHSVAHAGLSIQSADENYNFSLFPGETLEADINIVNLYSEKLSFEIYTVDGTKSRTGQFAARLRNEEQTTFGKWGTLEESEITMDPRENKTVKLIIDVPKTATPGDYSGAIVASRAKSPNGETADEPGVGLTFQTRLAVPFFLTIPGERVSKVDVGEVYYKKYSGNTYKLHLDLENKGNTSVKFILNTTINAAFGENKEINPVEIQLFPKEKVTAEVALGSLGPLNSYDITTNISYRDINIITGEEDPIQSFSKSLNILIIPWLEIGLALALIVIIISLFVHSKHKLRRTIKSSEKYQAKQGDSITEIAKANNVDWKLLAKINKLKPPYEIKPGQEILIPKEKK